MRVVSANARVDALKRRHGIVLEVVERDDLGPTSIEVLVVSGFAVPTSPRRIELDLEPGRTVDAIVDALCVAPDPVAF
jgi:hypothetical protein